MGKGLAMAKNLTRYRSTTQMAKIGLGGMILAGMLVQPIQAQEVFRLALDSRPFSPGLCKKQHRKTNIRIKAAQHRDLVIQRVPGQYIPENSQEARSKDYTYFITLNDLSNGALLQGAIAFRNDRAIIYTENRPTGMSRRAFVSSLHSSQQPIAIQALNTFLRLQPILNAAIDTCRPYPPSVTYGTDDEIDRIEAGRSAYHNMIEAYNSNPKPQHPLFIHEPGMSDGFFDPEVEQQHRVSYQAINPLSFYVAPGKAMTTNQHYIDGPR